jgi:hypothetical protein
MTHWKRNCDWQGLQHRVFGGHMLRALCVGGKSVFAVIILSLACWAAAGSRSTDRDVEKWVRAAHEYANGVSDVGDQFRVSLAIAEFHAEAREVNQACATAARISNEVLRDACLASVAWRLTESGDRLAAVQLVRDIKGRREREEGWTHVLDGCVARRDFAGAKATIPLIEDIGVQQDSWHWLASEEAAAGEYDSALSTAEKFRGIGFSAEKDRADLLQFIADARRKGMRKLPSLPGNSIYDRVRDMGGDYSVRAPEDLAEFRRRVAQPGISLARLCAWYHIANWCYSQDDLRECRKALRQGSEMLLGIADPYERLLHTMLIADMRLRLGDAREARQVIESNLTTERWAAAGELRDARALAARTISVWVRLDNIPEAFKVAQESRGRFGLNAWWAFGASCGVENKAAEVENRRTAVKSNAHAAMLCLGVAAGLQERLESERRKTKSR